MDIVLAKSIVRQVVVHAVKNNHPAFFKIFFAMHLAKSMKKLGLVEDFDEATKVMEKELGEDECNRLMCEWMAGEGSYTTDGEFVEAVC